NMPLPTASSRARLPRRRARAPRPRLPLLPQASRSRPCKLRGLLTATQNPAATVPEKELPAVELQGIAKLFGRFAALRDISGSFAGGKLYAIVGENGAGKSTLLRVIAGLASPTRGRATVLGLGAREASARIGYMAHSSMLYDELSGIENLRYFARMY